MTERRRRRQEGVSSSVILLALLLVVLGAVGAVEAYAGNGPLLVPGSTWVPGDAVLGAVPCPGERCDDVAFEPEAAVSFGQSVRNKGPLAVTILGFPGTENQFVRIDSVEVGRPGVMTTDAADSIPFDTITLQAGEERFLVFRGRFATCGRAAGDSLPMIEDSLPLRVRMIVLEHRREVALYRPLRFSGPDPGTC